MSLCLLSALCLSSRDRTPPTPLSKQPLFPTHLSQRYLLYPYELKVIFLHAGALPYQHQWLMAGIWHLFYLGHTNLRNLQNTNILFQVLILTWHDRALAPSAQVASSSSKWTHCMASINTASWAAGCQEIRHHQQRLSQIFKMSSDCSLQRLWPLWKFIPRGTGGSVELKCNNICECTEEDRWGRVKRSR